ncbi:MAG: ClbS/DfsB family four-helix bundle protein [Roseiflexaceae bacterium]
MTDTPTTMAELRERIDSSYAALEHTITQLSDAQLTTLIDGSWSAKDLLAHIAAWEQVMIHFHVGDRAFEEVTQLPSVPYATTPVDQINEAFYARDRDLPLAQVLRSFRSSHQELLAMLDTMSEADLFKSYTPSGRDGGQLITWIIGDSYDHYDEHRATMERLLGAQESGR